MRNTVLFGNGINRISDNAETWDDLLDKIKGVHKFSNAKLPNTMVYERIFMEKHLPKRSQYSNELDIKNSISKAMRSQKSNEIFELLISMNADNYLTTNYDYAFEESLGMTAEELSTEDIYSLRRKRKYTSSNGSKYLWNIHGEIDVPKSIMLGLDHYCGSISKIDSYVKGSYKHTIGGKPHNVEPMITKIKKESYCLTSWVDLFFSSNVHIIGFSLDYSETDIWWLLNKRARFSVEDLVNNKVYFYTNWIDEEKAGLLKSFNVEVVITEVVNEDYKSMYRAAISKMPFTSM